MTTLEKQEILNLRCLGKSYKEISNLTGFCESTVKTTCLRTKAKKERRDGYCKYCGKKLRFVSGKKEKQYCSDKCRQLYWHEHNDQLNKKYDTEIECHFCHRTFRTYKSLNKKFCSWECYLNSKQRIGGSYGQ